MQLLRPADNILAFYDGRIPGQTFMSEPNWVDDGALSVGIASYAIVSGAEALVYDTHVSLAHAREVRTALEAQGVRKMTVLLSHWHLDHVAGTEVFQDCEIIANAKTTEHLRRHKQAIEQGKSSGPPAISPLILPTRTFERTMDFQLGRLQLQFIEANIHSDDQSLIWMPQHGTLFAGDALEDTVTYVVEPQDFEIHLQELVRIKSLDARVILPNHGDPARIANGGYDNGLFNATTCYVNFLLRSCQDAELAKTPLKDILAEFLAAGSISWFEPYERVHEENLAAAMKLAV